jgi:F-box protein 9
MEADIIIPDDDLDMPVADGELNIENELERFRTQWNEEISRHSASGNPVTVATSTSRNPADNKTCDREALLSNVDNTSCEQSVHDEPSKEDQARYLFLQGVSAEQNGRLCNAIQYYRRAIQLVPDIELKVDDSIKGKRREHKRIESESSTGYSDGGGGEDLSDLIERIYAMRIIEDDSTVCQPNFDTKTTHLSSLPFELMTYIFKWVVSSDLDVLSLEQASLVCRGFYLCARDEELWKLVCLRTWGKNCGRSAHFGSYRNMFIKRPHLRFNGCYISKCSYFREGAKSLDNYYRPFHVVEYFRYIRFFPEGRVLMLTTPDDPYTTIPQLRSRAANLQGIMLGYYKLCGDTVTLILKRKPVVTDNLPSVYRYRRSKTPQNNNNNEAEQRFEVELKVKSIGERPHWQLVWSRYSMRTLYKSTGEETVVDFELGDGSYPNLNFSRVRSFTAVSDRPLK